MAFDRLPRKFCHPKDLAQRDSELMERKRAAWREDAVSPSNRVYNALERDTGYNYTGVTQAGSLVTWNPVTRMLEYMTSYSQSYSPKPAPKRVIAPVSGNRHKGGNF